MAVNAHLLVTSPGSRDIVDRYCFSRSMTGGYFLDTDTLPGLESERGGEFYWLFFSTKMGDHLYAVPHSEVVTLFTPASISTKKNGNRLRRGWQLRLDGLSKGTPRLKVSNNDDAVDLAGHRGLPQQLAEKVEAALAERGDN